METTIEISTQVNQVVLVGVSDAILARKLAAEMERWEKRPFISVLSTLIEVREIAGRRRSSVIVLDADLVSAAAFVPSVRALTEASPVVLLGSPEQQDQLLPLISRGQLEFVPRTGEFVPLAASLIQRRLRWAEAATFGFGALGAERDDLGEIFRHEINNPLTGILGNAEMLLAHRDHLRGVDVQRLQTVVDLAVRLRETIRRISDSLPRRSAATHAARAANSHCS